MGVITDLVQCQRFELDSALLLLTTFSYLLMEWVNREMLFALGAMQPSATSLHLLAVFLFLAVLVLYSTLVVVLFAKLLRSAVPFMTRKFVFRLFITTLTCVLPFLLKSAREPAAESLLSGFALRLENEENIEGFREGCIGLAKTKIVTNTAVPVIQVPLKNEAHPHLASLDPSWARMVVSSGGDFAIRLSYGGTFFPRWGVDILRRKESGWLLSEVGWTTAKQVRQEWKQGIYLWYDLEE